MATYKVPQDVEAEDKLLGPFTFRQFIYLGIVAAAIGIAVLLYKIIPPLAVIPLPIVLFFGALALPLKKDQPMEIYLAAILNFYLKPRKHFWDPDGIESLVRITAPRQEEASRIKDISKMEAEERLRYLSELSDTKGWSIRGVKGSDGSASPSGQAQIIGQMPGTLEASQTADVFDETNEISQKMANLMKDNANKRHQSMLSQFQSAISQPQQPSAATPAVPDSNLATITDDTHQQATPAQTGDYQIDEKPTDQSETTPKVQFDPYPTSMNQSVVEPVTSTTMDTSADESSAEASKEVVSPDIISLADNRDLSVATIASEAKRITEKNTNSDEVYIPLR